MAVDAEDFQSMTEDEYAEYVKQQQEGGFLQAQAEGRGPVPDESIGVELHREINDFGPKHVPHQTAIAWGVFAKQHPGLANLDHGEAALIKSFARNYERLLFTALPKGIMTAKLKRKIYQGRALAFLNISKGKGGFGAQMAHTTMIGVANTGGQNFMPRSTNRPQRQQSRFQKFRAWL